MKYSIDLEKLSVQEYKELLKMQNLLPGRRILWQDIDQNFTKIENDNIKTVEQLRKTLSTPIKIAAFASSSGISEDYLLILKRELSSFEQKPIPLADFLGIDPALIEQLNKIGIGNSREYYESGLSTSDELFCLSDLVRVNGIGAIAARAFYEAGYQSVTDIAAARAEEMLSKISAVNEIHHYYKAKLGIKDMQFCIDFAVLLTNYCSR